MAKKDDDIVKSLTETLKANTEVIGKVMDLLQVLVRPSIRIAGEPRLLFNESSKEPVNSQPLPDNADKCPDKLEPAPEEEPEPEPEPEEEEEEVTYKMCKEALIKFDDGGKNRSVIVELFAKFGGKALKDVKEEDYAALYRETQNAALDKEKNSE